MTARGGAQVLVRINNEPNLIIEVINAAAGGALVPLLTLGIPGSGTTAVLLGALMIYGLRPGPMLFSAHPDFVWGLVASMYIGNILMVILNMPLIGLF